MFSRVISRPTYAFKELQNRWRLRRITRAVAQQERPEPGQKPIAFFNASTRLDDISMNSAFSAIIAWGFRLSGIPVVHFVCHGGMSRCVLGSDQDKPLRRPPCEGCVAQSKRLYAQADVHWFEYEQADGLALSLPNKLCIGSKF